MSTQTVSFRTASIRRTERSRVSSPTKAGAVVVSPVTPHR